MSSYVHTDADDVMRIGDTRVPLESVVCPYDRGESAEGIARSYRSLTLEQVYGAIAYYLGHRDEVKAYLKRVESDWDRLRSEIDKTPNPTVERLRALLRERPQAELPK